jgi:hypothetical protein
MIAVRTSNPTNHEYLAVNFPAFGENNTRTMKAELGFTIYPVFHIVYLLYLRIYYYKQLLL